MNDVFAQPSFLHTLWLFYGVFVMHEFEEWNIDRFERRNFVGLPAAASDRSVHLFIWFISLVGLVWTGVAALPGNPTLAAWIVLPAIAIMIQNALQHIYWTYLFKQVAPGVATAALLVIPVGVYVTARAIEQGYVPIWYVAVWAAFVLIGFVQTIMAGNKMLPLVRGANSLGIWLSDRMTAQ